MNTKQLSETILEGGIRSVNFFNGRLLSGEDLTQERTANRTVDWRLGQAVGEGVAFGLEVGEAVGVSTRTAPVLSVAPGLAVNGRGRTLALTDTTNIALVLSAIAPPGTAGTFDVCLPPQSGTGVVGTGVYVLVLSPATAAVGRAPVSGLGDSGACGGATTCNTRYSVEGVQFRLEQLPLTAEQLNHEPLLRNLVAALCFGVGDPKRTAFTADPFGVAEAGYGLLDQLRADSVLTACDVPLGVVRWVAATGLVFIDLWSVRRRLTAPSGSQRWKVVIGDRRRSEAEAMLQQFHDHIASIATSEPSLASVTVNERFGYLPPAGLVPIADTGSPLGFDPTRFFGLQASADVALIDGNRLGLLLRESFDHEPIDISALEKIQLYLIRENVQAVQAGTSRQLTLVFASPTLPYLGVARFGSARWDLSRFASAVI